MNEEVIELWKDLCNAMMIYSGAAMAPRYLHLPDIVSSALSNNIEQTKSDIKLLVRAALIDSAVVFVSAIKDVELRIKLEKSVDSLNKIEDYETFRSKCADFMGYVLDELGVAKSE